mgnify:CR=1 FL=1
MERIMDKSLNELKRQIDRRGDELTLQHLPLLNALKSEIGGKLLTLDYAYIPDGQAEGFRLLIQDELDCFAKVIRILEEEDYFDFSGNLPDGYGYLFDKAGKIVRLRHNGAVLPDSFLRCVRHSDAVVIDIALYKKELPRVN